MKKLILLLMLGIPLLLISCGSDETSVVNPPAVSSTISADTSASAPTLSSVNEATWNSVTATIIDLNSGGFTKEVSGKAAVADQIAVQAIKKGGKLFLRLNWSDPDNSLNREPIVCNDTLGLSFTIYDSVSYGRPFAEDQLFIMFEGAPGGGWDVWNWRSLTTGKAFLAEGKRYNNGVFTKDAGSQLPALSNANAPLNRPSYIPNDITSFSGYVLYSSDAIPFQTVSGWTAQKSIPGYRIDTSVISNLENFPQSHWDIKTVDNYSGSSYTVVLARDLNTGYADDLDMSSLSSVNLRITVLENQISFIPTGSSNQHSSGVIKLEL